MKNKTLALLGLAARARKIIVGQALVLQACKQHPGTIVFLASDAGDNFTKKIRNKAETFGLTILSLYDSTALSKSVGKEHVTVILVADQGFSSKLKEYNHS